MLSAVAARRARLQESKSAQNTPAPPSSASSILNSPPSTSKSTKPPSKRRASQPVAPSSSKKPKKTPSKPSQPVAKKPRYFASAPDVTNAFAAQEDLILLGDGDSDKSVGSDVDGMMDEEPLDIFPEVGQPVRDKQTRAWTPSRPLEDSSDEDSEDNRGHGGAVGATIGSRILFRTEEPEMASSFRPIPDQNTFSLSAAEASSLGLSGESAVVLLLSPSATVSLVGTYQLRVLRGSISLLGVKLLPSSISHPVFAPRSSPIPVIEVMTERGESSRSCAVPLPERICTQLGEERDTAIALQATRTGVEGLGRVVRTFDGVFRSPNSEDEFSLASANFLRQTSRDAQLFHLPSSWNSALATSLRPAASQSALSAKPMVSLIRGSKNSGKSTLARTLLNRLTSRYRRIAFLECDLGQSEFTPGGMVALTVVDRPLFGPPFTHPTLPHQAHYIGSTSPRSSPSHYLNAIRALIQTYRLDLQFATSLVDIEVHSDVDDDRIRDIIPLVVNTMGWTKGLGADLSRKIEAIVEPTHIFELEAQTDQSWHVAHLEPHASEPAPSNDAVTYSLEGIAPHILSTRFSAADHRTIALMSYFHAVFPSTPPTALQQVTAAAWNTHLPLCAQPPYEVDAGLALDRVFLTGAGSEDVVPSELLRVLNGAIVGLVHTDVPAEDADMLPAAPALPYTQGAAPPDPASSSCVGLALLRGVSPLPPTRLHVLTPVPPHLLAGSRTLVKGELELPVWGMLDFRSESGDVAGVERTRVPYLRWGKGEGAGGERRRVRRNLMRRGQM